MERSEVMVINVRSRYPLAAADMSGEEREVRREMLNWSKESKPSEMRKSAEFVGAALMMSVDGFEAFVVPSTRRCPAESETD